MHNARGSSQDVWPDTVESKPVRLFDAVLAAVEYFRKMQKCFHAFGDASAGRNVHCSYTNLAKQDHRRSYFPH